MEVSRSGEVGNLGLEGWAMEESRSGGWAIEGSRSGGWAIEESRSGGLGVLEKVGNGGT